MVNDQSTINEICAAMIQHSTDIFADPDVRCPLLACLSSSVCGCLLAWLAWLAGCPLACLSSSVCG